MSQKHMKSPTCIHLKFITFLSDSHSRMQQLSLAEWREKNYRKHLAEQVSFRRLTELVFREEPTHFQHRLWRENTFDSNTFDSTFPLGALFIASHIKIDYHIIFTQQKNTVPHSKIIGARGQ